jgi:ribosome biogenesis GTPase
MVVTKCDLKPEYAGRIEACYKKAGFEVFLEGKETDGVKSGLKHYIETRLDGKIAAFSGASGVGKSTMLNKLFPELSLETGEISHRIERGKNTTRSVELYPLSEEEGCGFLADTPGFTMLDFERFDFFEKEDLPATFREFLPYIGSCKYTKCTHTKEEGCQVLAALKRGDFAKSRHESYLLILEEVKKKPEWKRKGEERV